MVRFRKYCSEEKHIRKYSDLIAVKARDYFGETSPRTFVTTGLIDFCCFQMDKYNVCRLEYEIRPPCIFREPSAARKFNSDP